jgi:hypothetical protein
LKLFGKTLFGKLGNAEIDAFARELCQEIVAQVPPGTEPPTGQSKRAERKLAKSLSRVLDAARAFQGEHQLGVYGKARVANTFKWELRELGYDGGFVEEATKALVLSLN